MLAHFVNDFQHPAPFEGYNRVLYVKPSDHPSQVYTRSEVADILKKVRDSPAVTSDIGSGTSFRGNLNRSSHGRWRRGFIPRGRGNGTTGSKFYPRPSGSFRGTYHGHSAGALRERGQWRYSSERMENQVRVSVIDGEGTGTTQDPFIID